MLDHEGVHVHERRLEEVEVEAEHCCLLIVVAVGRAVAVFAVVDESVRGVPVLDDVETFVDLAAELEGGEVVAHESRIAVV